MVGKSAATTLEREDDEHGCCDSCCNASSARRRRTSSIESKRRPLSFFETCPVVETSATGARRFEDECDEGGMGQAEKFKVFSSSISRGFS